MAFYDTGFAGERLAKASKSFGIFALESARINNL